VLEALPGLATRGPTIEWVVPLEEKRSVDKFAGPRDRTMLIKLGLENLAAELAKFWPARGPVWDALAICRFPDKTSGALLAEGKNYPARCTAAARARGRAEATPRLKVAASSSAR
jgi:hypothetical protein